MHAASALMQNIYVTGATTGCRADHQPEIIIAGCRADVRPESFLYFVGARGSGKTTLLNRFLYPDKACTDACSCIQVCRLGHLLSQAPKDVLAHVWLHHQAAGMRSWLRVAGTASLSRPPACTM